MRIFDQTFRTLERALDVRMARQGVLAGNLANVDTPGFVPRDLDFAAAMGEAGPASQLGSIATPSTGASFQLDAGELPLNLVAPAAPSLPGAPQGPGGLSSTLRSGSSAAPSLVSSGPGLDGNAVDADRALVALAENAIHYSAAAKAIAKKFAILRYVASDGNA